MGGIIHGWATTQTDDPAYDVSANELNTHVVNGDFDITGVDADPDVPAAGKGKLHLRMSGVTPNKHVVLSLTLEDGTFIPIADVTI